MDRTRDRLGSCRDAVHERLQSADPEQRLSPSRPRARASPPICAEGFNARTGAVSGHAGGGVEGASAIRVMRPRKVSLDIWTRWTFVRVTYLILRPSHRSRSWPNSATTGPLEAG